MYLANIMEMKRVVTKIVGFYSFFFLLFLNSGLNAQSKEIWELQGSSTSSPFTNQIVTTNDNVVTAVGSNFFFMQTPVSRSDNNPLTSDGIQVFTSIGPSVSVGDRVNITGRIEEQYGMTRFNNNNLQVNVIGTGASLPTPITLDPAFPSKMAASIPELERVEGMLVYFEGFATGPSNDLEEVPVTASDQRPFREPGIKYPGVVNLPVWDGNPEGFWFDPNGVDQPENRFITSGMEITATGVMAYEDNVYLFLPTSYSLDGEGPVTPVRDKQSNEITVGSLNLLLLVPDSEDYTKKLRKLSKYIVESMRTPDILAVQELGNFNALISLKNFIQQANPNSSYVAYYQDGPNNIKVGYLAKTSVFQNISVTQLGANEQISTGGQLHDRPPLLLEAEIRTDPPTPIKVLNVHMRSRIGIEGGDANFIRTKRHEQAISIAQMVQERQDHDLFVVGDFNAFEFTDGYVDVLSQIRGDETIGALYELEPVTDPELTNHTEAIAQPQRYSFVFEGDAQLIDHCLSTTLTGMEVVEVQFARGNCDQPVAFEDNDQLVNRASDHDGFVTFIMPDNPLATSVRELTDQHLRMISGNLITPGTSLIFEVTKGGPYQFSLLNAAGQPVLQQDLGLGTNSIATRSDWPTGMYMVQVKSASGYRSWKVVLQ